MCSHVCSVCYWLIRDALLLYPGVVSMRLHLPCFDVFEFRCGWLGCYPCGRLKHNSSVQLEFGGWGLMTVLNRGFISPGFCSGMSLPSRWRDWIFEVLPRLFQPPL